MTICFQGAGEHKQLFSGSWRARFYFWRAEEHCQNLIFKLVFGFGIGGVGRGDGPTTPIFMHINITIPFNHLRQRVHR